MDRSKTTNFQDVKELNNAFKMSTTTPSENIDWDVVDHQLAVIREETTELFTGREKKDLEKLIDAIGDSLVVIYGLASRMSIDCDELMKEISDSNFSKLCKTEEEVLLTQDHYTKMGVEVYVEQTEIDGSRAWAVKSAKDQTYNDGGEEKWIPKGKFLKNINWKSPNIKKFMV